MLCESSIIHGKSIEMGNKSCIRILTVKLYICVLSGIVPDSIVQMSHKKNMFDVSVNFHMLVFLKCLFQVFAL